MGVLCMSTMMTTGTPVTFALCFGSRFSASDFEQDGQEQDE